MTPAEIIAAIQAFTQLEPELQKGVAALISFLAGKQATKVQPLIPPVPIPVPGTSSTSTSTT